MVSISVFNQLPRPRVFAPGEYCVPTDQHRKPILREARWDSESESESNNETQPSHNPTRASSPGHDSESQKEVEMPSSPDIPLRETMFDKLPAVLSHIEAPAVLSHTETPAPAAEASTAPSRPRREATKRKETPSHLQTQSASKEKKKTTSRRYREANKASRAKTTPHKKRMRRATPEPMGPRTCLWAGCGLRLEDGRDVWEHIREFHDGGWGPEDGSKTTGSGKHNANVRKSKRKNCEKPEEKEQTKTKKTAPPRFMRKEIDDYDGDEDEVDDDKPVKVEPLLSDDGDLGGERNPKDPGDDGCDGDHEDSEPEDERKPKSTTRGRPRETNSEQKTDPWFDKVCCRWDGCEKEMQYMGLRRHVETKHVPMRGASCSKGCGYYSSRSDMLWRHVKRCRFGESDEEEEMREEGGGREMRSGDAERWRT